MINTLKQGESQISNFRYFVNVNTGIKYHNLGTNWDAKLDTETGNAWTITDKEYRDVEFSTVNELYQAGILECVNVNPETGDIISVEKIK